MNAGGQGRIHFAPGKPNKITGLKDMAKASLPAQKKNRTLALIYDFDGTLIDGNMPDQGLLGEIGWQAGRFWTKSNQVAKRHKADKVCVYMHMLMDEAKKAGRPITKRMLARHGREIRMRKGITGAGNWFARSDAIVRRNGLEPRHYVITSGLADMVEASPIARHLSAVFGSRYLHDAKTGEATGLAQVVNYTTKTQYLFRINKGVHDMADDKGLNDYMPEERRPVPFSRMLFVGDGFTDIPCFRLVKQSGGHSLAVLATSDSNRAMEQMESLVSDGRVDHISLGDHFVAGGRIERVVEKVAAELGASVN